MARRKQSHLKIWLFVVWLILLFFVVIGHAEEPQDQPLYFVQITDTHMGNVRHADILEEAVNQINRLPFPIQCVVHTGDIMADNIADTVAADKGRHILKRLKVPVHYLPGNHDIDPGNLEVTHQAYLERFGGLITRAEYQGVVFLLIYTEPLRREVAIEDYHPLTALEAHLKKSRDKPVIVFHHTPSVGSFFNNELHRGWKKEIRDEWVRLINAYGVKAVIAGHFHGDEHHWLGDVPLYISSAMAPYWGRQPTFRVYKYHDGKISYRTQYLE